MESLPYRATVFLRPAAVHTMGCADYDRTNCNGAGEHDGRPGTLDLMERSFAKEADAVLWCNVMSEAEPHATGAWFVAVSRGGRMMSIAREAGFFTLMGAGGMAGQAEELINVLATAGLPAGTGLSAQRVGLEPVGAA